MEAFHQAENGDLNLSETISVPADAVVGGSGVLQTLSENVSMTLFDVMTLMIIVSDNTASNLALERVGLDNVNRLCGNLGSYDTKIQRYFMDIKAVGQVWKTQQQWEIWLIFLKKLHHQSC